MVVTDDIAEAILLADRIGMMSVGPRSTIAKILEVGMPRPRDLTDPKVAHLFMRSRHCWSPTSSARKSGRRRPNERRFAGARTDGQRSRRQAGSDRRTARARRPAAAAALDRLGPISRCSARRRRSRIAFSIWQLSTFIFNPFLIPPPIEVIRTAIPMVMSGEILADVTISTTTRAGGFVSGSLIGIARRPARTHPHSA